MAAALMEMTVIFISFQNHVWVDLGTGKLMKQGRRRSRDTRPDERQPGFCVADSLAGATDGGFGMMGWTEDRGPLFSGLWLRSGTKRTM